MNFFRSEEHLRRWEGFENREGGTISLDSVMELFSAPYCKNRSTPDYVSHMSEYLAEYVGRLAKLPDAGDHWRM